MTRFMRENGLTSLKSDGIELILSPQALFPQVESLQEATQEDDSIPISTPQFEEQEILLWSAPGNAPESGETH